MKLTQKKLKSLIQEEISNLNGGKQRLNENFRTIGPSGIKSRLLLKKMRGSGNQNQSPEYYRRPKVDKHDPKFQCKFSEDFNRGFFKEYKGSEINDNLTAEAHTLLDVSKLNQLFEGCRENDLWEATKNGWKFGEYPLYSTEEETGWHEFMESFVEHGPSDPIQVKVYENGNLGLLSEYALAAYNFLGIEQIPAHVKWYGGVQGTERDRFKEHFERSKLPKNAESLEHYFDNVSGMWFQSDRKRVNWVNGDSDTPLSPKEAFETGNYKQIDKEKRNGML